MKGFKCSLLLCIFVISLIPIALSATTVSSKPYKKLLEKLRGALNSTELEDSLAAVLPNMEEEMEKVMAQEEEQSSISLEVEKEKEEEEVKPEVETENGKPLSPAPSKEDLAPTVSEPTVEENTVQEVSAVNAYMVRFRNVVKRVLELLGLRRRKDGRKSRLLAITNDNDIERPPVYQEEVRTTVGAVLGQKECLRKVACVSGLYLKGVQGKQLIFALLDIFSPSSWKETVKIAKQSAIFNESCPYKCLEE